MLYFMVFHSLNYCLKAAFGKMFTAQYTFWSFFDGPDINLSTRRSWSSNFLALLSLCTGKLWNVKRHLISIRSVIVVWSRTRREFQLCLIFALISLDGKTSRKCGYSKRRRSIWILERSFAWIGYTPEAYKRRATQLSVYYFTQCFNGLKNTWFPELPSPLTFIVTSSNE